MRRSASVLCLLTLGLSSFASAQNRTEFEAASVKQHVSSGASAERAGIEENKALIRIDNLSLRVLIGMAYRVNGFQIDGPDWLDADTFDIVAKPETGYQRDQLAGLLQKLLADRFKLEVHHETRPASAYALVAAKGGSTLRETTGPRTYLTARPGLIEGKERSMTELKNALSKMLDRPVEDRTALTGNYDIRLEWNPRELESPPDAATAPSLFTALQEQLGLKLERITMPVEFIVVDHAQRTPVAN